ncbi:MAG: hypothetical protein DI527_18115 [Chelatococcus sp.]|nr:MAG: hypothetical protein DI527_18115 [Chelatococcus sp.]
MKALTIWQPWASLIAIGAKPYEFRGWRPPPGLVGEDLGIHAGARPVRLVEVVELIARLENPLIYETPCLHREPALELLRKVRDGLHARPAGGLLDEETPFRLPLSSMLGIARVGVPKRGDDCAREFDSTHGNDSDRDGTFNWGWPLTDFRPFLPPIPMKGAQGLWEFRP